ncbi:MAG: aminotransferase class I/II-fold pyridoxal phosphate-dependent enzyme [Paracoccaceae bacterium]|nr:aminotransferase class I/II-fold pyridoxal phosphate-dependent enzyme [Paracoccaceae bacterium]MDG1368802.1 aminotransferase class I/II-fold pyridoxal phosphate-dependent enzyme [Paracoccaceae bacterium]
MSLEDKVQKIQESFGALKALGRDPTSLEFDRVTSPTEAELDGKKMILLGTNNYLGLTFDESCVAAAKGAIDQYGTGTTGSRIANGTYGLHKQLEQRVADFYGKRSAMVYSTGYTANLGSIAALAQSGDQLLIDADSHASIYDACRMSDAEVIRFRHNDPDNLAKKLERLQDRPGDKIVVTEGIYSMLGDSAPLKEIVAVKKEYGAYLMVDEAHSLGVMGARGRGLCEQDDVEADCDFIVGTFSKSIGTVGGFCVSDHPGLDALRSISRPYMFTASLPPAVIAAAQQSFDQIDANPQLRDRLWRNARILFDGLEALGFKLGPEVSPVVAIMLPGKEVAVRFWNALMEAGVYTNIAIPPSTPNALSLLRSSISAAHTRDQIATALDVFAQVGADLDLIPANKADRRRLAEAQGPLRIVTGGNTQAKPVQAPVQEEQRSSAAKR